ncbi:Protein serine/threonine phosphatase PrpC, regulation of stationary phase [Olavius algarvensis associated proteobacterium Delta 3]|nr:Protein serine/threonine phosphatase PrpC, regulation of stationary phase [Olavius algarvensis associated proteobacterium Delta 3]
MTQMTIGAATHPGKRKTENEDSYDVVLPEGDTQDRKGILLILADGMGGHAGGAVASRTAVDVVMEQYLNTPAGDVLEALRAAFQKANAAVLEKSARDRSVAGMATTLTAVVIKDDLLFHAHVGDSRAYVIDGSDMAPITEDHSYVASLVAAGAITAAEAETHPQRNLVTRAVGALPDLAIDAAGFPRPLKKDQHILLCCDGLFKVVPENEIQRIIESEKEPNGACEKLVERANDYGGPDNITVILARIDRVKRTPGFIRRFITPAR